MTSPRLWRLERFVDAHQTWAQEQAPDGDLRRHVALWIFTRMEDPYQGVERQVDVAGNFWWGWIPGSRKGDSLVTCSYWIYEQQHLVRCDNFATLGLPL
jgi:hypothetical protein